MPWYEYECLDCGMKFARLRPMDERNNEALCECTGVAKRVLSVPAIIVRSSTKETFPDVDGETMKKQGYEWED